MIDFLAHLYNNTDLVFKLVTFGPLVVGAIGLTVSFREKRALAQAEAAAEILDREEIAALNTQPVVLPVLPADPSDVDLSDALKTLAAAVDACHGDRVMRRTSERLAPVENAQRLLEHLRGALRQWALYPPYVHDSSARVARRMLVEKLQTFTAENGANTNAGLVHHVNSVLKSAVILFEKADKGCSTANPKWFSTPEKAGQDRGYLVSFPSSYNLSDASCSPHQLAHCIDQVAHSISACLAMATPYHLNLATQNGPALLRQLAALRDEMLLRTSPDLQTLVRQALARLPQTGQGNAAHVRLGQGVAAHVRDTEAAFAVCFQAMSAAQKSTPAAAPAPGTVAAPASPASVARVARAPARPQPLLDLNPPPFVVPSTLGLPPLDALRVVAMHLLTHPQAAARTFGAGVLPPLADITGWLNAHPQDEHRVAALVDAAAPRAVKTLALYARLTLVADLNPSDLRSLADAELALAELPRLLAAYHRALLSSDFRQLDLLVQEMRVIDLQLDAPAGYATAKPVPA